MATAELITEDHAELAKFRRQDAAIAELAKKYGGLKIAGLNDKAGFQAVHSARMAVKNTRVAIEAKRKELKADALQYGRDVDAEAKRLTLLIEPIESHLQREEDAITAEKARLIRIAEEAKQAALQKRIDAMRAVAIDGAVANPIEFGQMTEPTFQLYLAEETKRFNEHQKKLAEAAEVKRKAEEAAAAERAKQDAELKAERVRLDETKRQQAAEMQRLLAMREKLEREEEARRRLADLERAKIEAADKARAETEKRIADQAAAEKAKAEAAEAARLKAESERPYREQLQSLADKVLGLEIPSGSASMLVRQVLVGASQAIRKIAENKLD